MTERRKDKRTLYDPPEFVSVTFTLDDGTEQGQTWSLAVMDCSRRGLRLLLTEIDSDLLKLVKPGGVIKNITFYGESTLIRVDATVKHITEIAEGPYKGQRVIGLESSDIITSCMPLEGP